MITYLEILLITLTLGSTVFYLSGAILTYRFFTKIESNEKLLPTNSNQPISLLVPVRGIDPGAWENLLSLCNQNYPDYEILFGVTEINDPAIPLLEKLAAEFPGKVKLFTGLQPRGINHKDSNLSYLLEKANHEIIVFADSDIRVESDYLHTVTTPLEDGKTGLVTCAFIGHNPQSVGAALASLGRCVDFIPSVLIARWLDGGLRFAVGATMATRKSILDSIGGLHLSRIGSDYNLGKRTALSGYQVKLSPYILESDTGFEGIDSVFQRELRWARTIRYNRGSVYYAMIFCYGSWFSLPLIILSNFSGWAIALGVVALLILSS